MPGLKAEARSVGRSTHRYLVERAKLDQVTIICSETNLASICNWYVLQLPECYRYPLLWKIRLGQARAGLQILTGVWQSESASQGLTTCAAPSVFSRYTCQRHLNDGKVTFSWFPRSTVTIGCMRRPSQAITGCRVRRFTPASVARQQERLGSLRCMSSRVFWEPEFARAVIAMLRLSLSII